jgi:hypothetical protein
LLSELSFPDHSAVSFAVHLPADHDYISRLVDLTLDGARPC